ncbi:MAG: 5-formyltetrahydrofolate cyclo-ligase [Verrucomicrobium sp.]
MTEGTIHQIKSDLRQSMQARLRAVTDDTRADWSAAIRQHLSASESWALPGGAVAIFGGMRYEPEVLFLLPRLVERGFTVALFGLKGSSMAPYRVRRVEDLMVGSFGVLEPVQVPEHALRVADLGTVLVPGLAFGLGDGNRLGRGKGHYDRILGHPDFRGQPIGVGFHLQFLENVPGEEHDIRLPLLLSESGWVQPGASPK